MLTVVYVKKNTESESLHDVNYVVDMELIKYRQLQDILMNGRILFITLSYVYAKIGCKNYGKKRKKDIRKCMAIDSRKKKCWNLGIKKSKTNWKDRLLTAADFIRLTDKRSPRVLVVHRRLWRLRRRRWSDRRRHSPLVLDRSFPF